VAEHCWHCSNVVPPEDALEALLHDAAEAYLGDLIRPLKLLPELGGAYLKLERQLEACIAERFGLTYPWPATVKAADEAVITAEMEQIIEHSVKGDLHDASVMADIEIHCWTPIRARMRFLDRYEVLSRV
jgi:5'-deoxynucleotidase YfbR-like HD superfamily hydrolase